jgi:hypothetical protein
MLVLVSKTWCFLAFTRGSSELTTRVGLVLIVRSWYTSRLQAEEETSCETSSTYGPVTSAISAISLNSIGRPDRVLLYDDSPLTQSMRGCLRAEDDSGWSSIKPTKKQYY